MAGKSISLPDTLKSLVDEVAGCDHGVSSEHVRELIRRDQGQHLRALLREGEASAPGAVADEDYFDGLRDRARGRRER